MDGKEIRVAERIELAKLKIVILDHGERVRFLEVEDPRGKLIRQINDQGAENGLMADVA